MQDHSNSFVVEATPAEVWNVWFGSIPVGPMKDGPHVMEYGDVRIEYLHGGDENHDGLIRHCFYPVPKSLLTGGRAESWEMVTDIVPNVSQRYVAITKPPFARAEGWQTLEALPDGRTRVHFRETYSIDNPISRVIFERRLHRRISRDNDRVMQAGLAAGVQARRAATG